MHSNNPIVILTPGYTGEDRICNRIKERLRLAPDSVVPDNVVQNNIKNQIWFQLGISMEKYTAAELGSVTTVLSFREDLAASVLSRIVDNHFKTWIPGNDITVHSKPFEANFNDIESTFLQWAQWYYHYFSFLKSGANIISYEVMTELLGKNNCRSVDYKNLIANYDDANTAVQQLIQQTNLKMVLKTFADQKTRLDRQGGYKFIL